MKKILPLLILLLTCVTAINAQQRKTWDFTKGISDATFENLSQDATNWTVTLNTDGTFKEAKDAKKLTGTLKANGVVIEELRGLVFGGSGLSSNNNYILANNKFRLSRKNESITLRVVPGQTITFKARSANKTKSDRGFKGDDNLEYISGPEGGICRGADVALETEPRDERGDYTLVWKVKEDAVTTLEGDSLDVTITTAPDGGLDISSIMIDEGDLVEEKATSIAYIFDSSYPGYNGVYNTILTGPLQNVLGEEAEIDPIDVSGDVSSINREALEGYSAVVVGSAIDKDNAIVPVLKNAIAYVPMLNLNANIYEAWGYGKAAETTSGSILVPESARGNDLFADNGTGGEGILEDGTIAVNSSANLIGVTIGEGSLFEKDDVLGADGDITLVHVHKAKRNAYMFLPYANEVEPTDNITRLIPNAVKTLLGTKTEVVNASKPAITLTYRDQYTIVSLGGSTAGSVFYYTTDGSEPTIESTLYTGPFEIHDANVTVKAIADAEGYNPSSVQEKLISIYSVSAAPTISLNKESGKTTVTITGADANDVIFYNFRNSTDTLACSRYSEPFELTKHATITAFAAQYAEDGTYLPSEAVTEDITVLDEKVRLDVVSHFDANNTQWETAAKIASYPFYTEEIIGTEEGTDSDGLPYTKNIYKPADQLTVVNPGSGWELKTYGQATAFVKATVGHNVTDFNGYNPLSAWDDAEYEATNSIVQFGSRNQNLDGETDPSSACIQSTEYFQAPLDITCYVGGYNSKAKVYVSADTLNAESWIELGEVYGGNIKGTDAKGKDGSNRLFKRNIVSYDGTDLVAVKVAAVEDGGTANILDIYVKNFGELSKEYTGIKDVRSNTTAEGEIVRTMIYSINGTQLGKAAKGINIIKEVYANGAVKTRKVFVK